MSDQTDDARRRAVPTATYRLQVHAGFRLEDAADVVGYLADLGVTHAYSSPLLRSAEDSNHGYDTVDHAHIDEARGGRPGFDRFVAALHERGLGLVLDLVPNHMGVADAAAAPWWWDVLRHGRDSLHAGAFDIDWEFGGGKVRIPVLGSADDVEKLEVVGREGGGGADGELRYYDNRFPIAPGTLSPDEGTPRPLEVHARQHYELVDWRRADTDLNYRRFFAINTLAGLRVEDPAIFDATHELVLQLVRDGAVDGLRIDHPDGLADPKGYLARLADASGGRWTVVEKILEPGEDLPGSWRTAGTTGYDALTEVDDVLVDPAGEPAFTALDTELSGRPVDYARLVHDCKREVTDGMLGSEVARLVRVIGPLSGVDRAEQTEALAELLASFPVYRSYLPDGREHLDATVSAVRNRRPDLVRAVDALHTALSQAGTEAATRFEQTSGPVMAKGVEDTAYYRWARFAMLNEVGGDPAEFGSTVAEFHEAQVRRAERRPESMTTLSTHDTKRSEDVRARLAVLAELPTEWTELVRGWLDRHPLPDRPMAHLVWQNLVGAWPLSRDRAHAYVEKAAREAGTSTTWTDPDEEFERRLHALVDAAFDDPTTSAEIDGFVTRIAPFGWSNSLAQKLLQLTMPGVPDVYQGTELWDFSLVDPDNRRPVDYALRRELLASLDGGKVPAVDETGAAKLLVVSRALRARRDHPEWFAGYAPVEVSGSAADNVVAFDRGGAVTVATRLPVRLAADGWGDTALQLPTGAWRDLLTGERIVSDVAGVAVDSLLARLPVALLARG